jgi:hypothetical protein
MTSNQYSDVRQAYKFAIVYESFTEIAKVCEYLITARTLSTTPEYFAMAVGIVTLYGRPFTNNARIGMISTRLVPSKFKALHSNLMNFRNKAFAHTDSAGQLPGHGRMTEVRLVFNGKRVESFSSRPIFQPVLLPDIKTLSESLAQKVEQSRDHFLNRILKVIVPQFNADDIGKEFELNVEDESGPIVVPSIEPIVGKYPLVRPLPRN